MSDMTEAPAYAAGVDRTGRWWVTAPDGAYRFGGGPRGRDAAQAAALRANEGGAIGVPPWPTAPPEVRPADESVEVPIRGNDLLNEDSYDSDTTRAAADGYDERLWRRRGF